MKFFSYSLIFLLSLSNLNCSSVQATSARPMDSEERKIISDNKIDSSHLSYYLIDIDSGEILKGHRSRAKMIPASIMKVPTTYMGLKTLGADRRFMTSLSYTGKINQDRLEGNLFLKGGGDPAFSKRELLNFALSLHHLGVKTVTGNFFYDDQILPNISKLSSIGVGDQTYNPSVSALSLDFNVFSLIKQPSPRGPFRPVPDLESFSINSVDEEFPPGLEFRFDSNEKGSAEHWELSQKQNYSFVERLPVRRPSLQTAFLLHSFLSQLGINVSPPKPGLSPKNSQLIASQKSQDLIRLVESNLEYSNNLLAELILLHGIKAQGSNPQDLKSASKKMINWYHQKYPEAEWDQANVINGSGLTAESRISSYTLTSLLKSIYKEKFQGRYYWSLLPTAGRGSWLKNRLNHPDLLYKLWAKTGSLNFVNNLMGYFISRSGRKIAFTLMINNRVNNHLMRDMSKSPRDYEQMKKGASSWRRSANKTQDELLQYWAKRY